MAAMVEGSKASSKEDAEEDTIQFVSGNPFVEVTKGVLHLYKEDNSEGAGNYSQPSRTSNTICMLSVPASMSCHDLMNFMAAFHDDIKNVKIIRDGSPNQYMSLVSFRSEEAAKAFYGAFDGAPFNSLEPDQRCHLVFVSRVETVGEEPTMVPPPAHNELPTCPVCLERMDESLDVILAILCNHAFHGGCLAKWEDASCPVCRYVQTPEAIADNRCMECHSGESLWICLLCGHVGCGRYIGGHAYEHYLESQHCYCMELENNRVWDYVGDNFVHRLLQNKGDGKLVEGPAPPEKDDEKLDSMQMEFTYLLSSQLEAQRKMYEDKIAEIEQQANIELNEIKHKSENALKENETLKQRISNLIKDKQSLDKRVQQQTLKINQLQTELAGEREMNKGLHQNQVISQEKLKKQDEELVDVREQIRDLMFSLEAGRVIASSSERAEIAEGTIVVGETKSTGKGRNRRNKHK